MAAPKAVKTFTIPAPPAKTTGAFEWEGTLANLLGITYSANVKKFFDAWHTSDNSNASNNPFNITVDYTGTATGDLANNSAKVKNFPSAVDGLKATAAFIQKNTPQIITTLNSGDYKGAADSIGQAGWDGGPNAAESVKQHYSDSIYKNYLAGAYTIGNNAPTKLSPADKAQVSVIQETTAANDKANSPGYINATTDLTTVKDEARASAEATAHVADGTQWVVEQKNKIGDTIGFSYSTGPNPPKNVLLINGAPATKNDLSASWNSQYADTFAQFTGKQATPAQISKILASGVSVYGLRSQLATQPAFTTSPVYKSSAAGLQGDAKTILGGNAPQSLINQALAENWDQNTFQAKLRALPAYTKGPEFQTNVAQMTTTYQGIYGTPDPSALQTIKESAAAGWSTDQFASYLRAQPEYKTSLEYATNATNFLDSLGLLTGSRPTLKQGKPITGGSTVPNSPLVPGAPSTLTSPLALKPALDGSQGLAA